jgi:hypothetical protein
MSENVKIDSTFTADPTLEADTNKVFWRPQPLIEIASDGSDITGLISETNQLAVPANIGFRKNVPKIMDENDIKRGTRETSVAEAAMIALASQINIDVATLICYQGSNFVKRTVSATGFDDVAEIDNMLNSIGVPMDGRYLALSSANYNKMASNLAARQTMNEMPTKAYKKAYVGEVCNFETFKLDWSLSLTASTASSVTVNGANQSYTPVSDETTLVGVIKKDNRFQTINLTVGSGVLKAGDSITFAGVNSVHMQTKGDTGNPKTFRIISAPAGGGTGAYVIAPPIISNGTGGGVVSDAGARYRNVTATPANGAAVTILNTATKSINPFWLKNSIELIASKVALPKDAGVSVVSTTLKNGLAVTMSKQADIKTYKTIYRWDTAYGIVNLNPEMNGIILFDQS